MSAPIKKLRAVPAPSEADPVTVTQAALSKAVDASTRARDTMTAARLSQQKARQRFDDGDATVSVTDLAAAAELTASAERKYKIAEDAESAARIALAQRESERASETYDQKVARATSWRARMGALLARFYSLDEELSRVVEEAVDVIGDAADAHSEAETLEAVCRPIVKLAAKGITAPTIEEAKELVRIAIHRARAKAGRDSICDQWLDGLAQPDWREPSRARFNAAIAALDELEGKSR